MLSDRGTVSLHVDRDGVIGARAFEAVYGVAAFDVLDGSIFVTVDGVGFGG